MGKGATTQGQELQRWGSAGLASTITSVRMWNTPNHAWHVIRTWQTFAICNFSPRTLAPPTTLFFLVHSVRTQMCPLFWEAVSWTLDCQGKSTPPWYSVSLGRKYTNRDERTFRSLNFSRHIHYHHLVWDTQCGGVKTTNSGTRLPGSHSTLSSLY